MIDADATIQALLEQLAATPLAQRPHERGAIAYRLGLAYAESPSGPPEQNLRSALQHYEMAAAVFDPRLDPVEHARVRNASGAAQRALGHRTKAVPQFERAAALFAGQGREEERAAALNNLGLTLTELGQREAALDAFASAVELFEGDGAETSRGRAASLINRAGALASAGTAEALRAALADYDRAAAMVDDQSAPYHWALASHNRGVVAMDLAALDAGESDRLLATAVSAFRSSLTVFTRTAFPFQHALAKHNLGRAHLTIGGLPHLRRALGCFEDATAVLDPRLHADAWRRAHAGLADAEEALTSQGHGGTRIESFVALLGTSSPIDRMALLRERLVRLLGLPEGARQTALADLAAASAVAGDQALAIMTDELTVLTELPTENLESALLARLGAHQRLSDTVREAADAALGQAVGDALNGPQRVFVRDFLSSHGYERP